MLVVPMVVYHLFIVNPPTPAQTDMWVSNGNLNSNFPDYPEFFLAASNILEFIKT
jgi:hypothetical protein